MRPAVRPAPRALARLAREKALKLCIHAAESQAEAELIRSGTGPIAEMFDRRGIVWQPPRSGATAYLGTLGVLGRNMPPCARCAVGCGGAACASAGGSCVSSLPKSNAKLGNGVADLGMHNLALTANRGAGPRIGIGSDSVASNTGMDLFEEMRFAVLMQRGMQRKISALTAKEAVEMATIGGAKSRSGSMHFIGSLEPGKLADICRKGLTNCTRLLLRSIQRAGVCRARHGRCPYNNWWGHKI